MAERLTLFNEYGRYSEAAIRPITNEEAEMFRRFAKGETQKSIAAGMGVSSREVATGSTRVILNMIYRVTTIPIRVED